MSTQVDSTDLLTRTFDEQDCFNIVLAYQDQESAARALRTCDKIASGLGSTFHLNKAMWKFDLLKLPKMRAIADDDAAAADMIIFAMEETTELPESVCQWIEKGMAMGQEKPRAIVALTSKDADFRESIGLDYLRKFAEARDLAFFSKTINEDGTNSYSLSA